ncbi:MAG: conserved protein, permease-related protein [Desulfobacteraceae bacterium 4572_123]|nr:MAG: conserved protein, permease-related protein [Desulfobacteraceae bacterium 4572_123]
MYYLYGLVFLSVMISFFADRDKTRRSVKIAFRKFIHILPAFAFMLIIVSIILSLLPNRIIADYLGGSNMFEGVILASAIGSITLMPGFIAFPLCGILLSRGVSYTVLSAFTTTLMMVGFVTFPIEKKYFGTKVTIIRNGMSFFIAVIVAIMTGIFYGEIIPWG